MKVKIECGTCGKIAATAKPERLGALKCPVCGAVDFRRFVKPEPISPVPEPEESGPEEPQAEDSWPLSSSDEESVVTASAETRWEEEMPPSRATKPAKKRNRQYPKNISQGQASQYFLVLAMFGGALAYIVGTKLQLPKGVCLAAALGWVVYTVSIFVAIKIHSLVMIGAMHDAVVDWLKQQDELDAE